MLPTSRTTTEPSAEPAPLTPDEFKVLVTRLSRDLSRVRTVQRTTIRITMASLGAGVVLHWGGSSAFIILILFCVYVGIELACFLVWSSMRKDYRGLKRLCQFIENTQDAAQIGTIINLSEIAARLGDPWYQLLDVNFDAVCRLIPLIQSQHAPDLNAQHRVLLRQLLFLPESVQRVDHWIGLEYCIPMLHALEQIGDKRDLPDVERLLKEPYITNNRFPKEQYLADEIKIAAEHCAEIIRERVAREEGKDFLLRPERKPEAVHALLRPSEERSGTPNDQLLRATSADEGDTPI